MRLGRASALALVIAVASARQADAFEARAWAVDDGARIRRGELDSPLARGDDNPVWRPGAPIRLSAFRDEVVAFQIVIEAGDSALSDVAVDLPKLVGASGA